MIISQSRSSQTDTTPQSRQREKTLRIRISCSCTRDGCGKTERGAIRPASQKKGANGHRDRRAFVQGNLEVDVDGAGGKAKASLARGLFESLRNENWDPGGKGNRPHFPTGEGATVGTVAESLCGARFIHYVS